MKAVVHAQNEVFRHAVNGVSKHKTEHNDWAITSKHCCLCSAAAMRKWRPANTRVSVIQNPPHHKLIIIGSRKTDARTCGLLGGSCSGEEEFGGARLLRSMLPSLKQRRHFLSASSRHDPAAGSASSGHTHCCMHTYVTTV